MPLNVTTEPPLIFCFSWGSNRLHQLGAVIYLWLFEYIWTNRNRSFNNNIFQWWNNRKQFSFFDKKVGCIFWSWRKTLEVRFSWKLTKKMFLGHNNNNSVNSKTLKNTNIISMMMISTFRNWTIHQLFIWDGKSSSLYQIIEVILLISVYATIENCIFSDKNSWRIIWRFLLHLLWQIKGCHWRLLLFQGFRTKPIH